MKCLIFSDSHGTGYTMREALRRNPDAEVVFFLGDGISDFDAVAGGGAKAWLPVRGNCDFAAHFRGESVRNVDEITLEGKKIVFTHGHLYGAKYGTEGLLSLAADHGADIVLFGHTHEAYEEYVDGAHPVWLFNPGTASVGDFGVLTLAPGSVLLSHGCVL